MKFITQCFHDANNKPSFSRLATAVLIIFALIWVTRLVWINKTLPDFSGLCFLVGTLYGLDKAGQVADKIAETTKTNGKT
jgi:hypothetical protein